MTDKDPCFLCEIRKWPIEKILDVDFFWERKDEFYPTEEFGEYVKVCDACDTELLNYFYREKFSTFLKENLND